MDTKLTMRGRSSSGIFDSLPDAVELITKIVYEDAHLGHLLDELLSESLDLERCDHQKNF